MFCISFSSEAAKTSLSSRSVISAAAIVLCVLLVPSAKAQTSVGPTIETVAGDGTPGYNGDHIPATKAELYEPTGVAIDVAENLFIADSANDAIRKVNARTGIISTVAGSFRCAFGGDGGPATEALLCSPGGVAFDARGNMYIADTSNQRIRRVDAGTQVITTVAGIGVTGFSGDGGPAANATFNNPNGLKVDAYGNLYIADTGNMRVRRIDHATGIITTVAGGGAGGLGGPAVDAALGIIFGVVLDRAGNLFLADGTNNFVDRVDHTTGIITAVAGNGIEGFSGDGGPATEAELSEPADVTFDRLGNLYITDLANQRVRRVDGRTGFITTLVGNGNAGFSGDGGPAAKAEISFSIGLAVDQENRLYIGDQGNQRIRRVQPLF